MSRDNWSPRTATRSHTLVQRPGPGPSYERIELAMVDGNEASIRVAEANGFQLREIVSGGATLDGRPADERIYDFPLPN